MLVQEFLKLVFNSVLSFRRVTHFGCAYLKRKCRAMGGYKTIRLWFFGQTWPSLGKMLGIKCLVEQFGYFQRIEDIGGKFPHVSIFLLSLINIWIRRI